MSVAPELAWLVAHISYKPGWKFALRTGPTRSSGPLDDSHPLSGNAAAALAITIDYPVQIAFFVIEALVPDSGNPDNIIKVQHEFLVPYPTASVHMDMEWDRWVLHCLMQVESHEAREFFGAAKVRPFYPQHGANADPYAIRRVAELPYPVREESQ